MSGAAAWRQRSAGTAPRLGAFDDRSVGYADCGTGGRLAQVCAEEGVEMLSGAHCYQFFATAPRFDEIQDHAIGLLPDRLPRRSTSTG